MKSSRKLNAAGAATLLGQLGGRPLSERTIRSWLSRGLLPFHRLGPKLVVFDQAELVAWFESHRGGPNVQLQGSSERHMS